MDRSRSAAVTPNAPVIILGMALLVVLIIGLGWPVLQQSFPPAPSATQPSSLPGSATPESTLTASTTQGVKAPEIITATPEANPPKILLDTVEPGMLVLSIVDNGYAHLFAFHPQTLPLTRLTNHPWDDIAPSISPDGQKVAFASRRNGYWDLYLLDLASGFETRLTDTPDYDSAPDWSPDGRWLAYETYRSGSLGISVLSVNNPSLEPIHLVEGASANFSPSWSPVARQIAFVSDRSGNDDIWVADLDHPEQPFRQLTHTPLAMEEHPTWSPDGTQLAWAVIQGGRMDVQSWEMDDPRASLRILGPGDWPCWSPTGSLILTRISSLTDNYLSAYHLDGSYLALPPTVINGSLFGLDWHSSALPQPLPPTVMRTSLVTPTPLWTSSVLVSSGSPTGRDAIVPIEGVTAPHPMLSDQVDESFRALRQRVADEAGWDFLGSLENAYSPLISVLPPGLDQDWLFTGRAIATSFLPVDAGWLVTLREDYGSETAWRLYIRARFQDGSQGMPLRGHPWDLNTRFSGRPEDYEQGGSLNPVIPPGYWIDFTDLAARYGWERLAADPNWRTFFPGTRVTEFVLSDGLDWHSAMLQIYPPEALETPVSPTVTPSPTPYWYQLPSPSPTWTPTEISTRRPTWTPAPEQEP